MADTTIKPVAQQPVAVEPAIVIGAGAAGLSAAHALIKAGVPTAILEKESRLAEPWHRRHLNLHLNTHRDLSSLPGVSFPAGTPAFPPRTLVIRHLKEFSETHGLPVQFGVAVEEIAFKGDHWAVLTSAGPRLARGGGARCARPGRSRAERPRMMQTPTHGTTRTASFIPWRC